MLKKNRPLSLPCNKVGQKSKGNYVWAFENGTHSFFTTLLNIHFAATLYTHWAHTHKEREREKKASKLKKLSSSHIYIQSGEWCGYTGSVPGPLAFLKRRVSPFECPVSQNTLLLLWNVYKSFEEPGTTGYFFIFYFFSGNWHADLNVKKVLHLPQCWILLFLIQLAKMAKNLLQHVVNDCNLQSIENQIDHTQKIMPRYYNSPMENERGESVWDGRNESQERWLPPSLTHTKKSCFSFLCKHNAALVYYRFRAGKTLFIETVAIKSPHCEFCPKGCWCIMSWPYYTIISTTYMICFYQVCDPL